MKSFTATVLDWKFFQSCSFLIIVNNKMNVFKHFLHFLTKTVESRAKCVFTQIWAANTYAKINPFCFINGKKPSFLQGTVGDGGVRDKAPASLSAEMAFAHSLSHSRAGIISWWDHEAAFSGQNLSLRGSKVYILCINGHVAPRFNWNYAKSARSNNFHASFANMTAYLVKRN